MGIAERANAFHVMSLPVEYVGFQEITKRAATVDIRVVAFSKYGGPHSFADFYVSRNIMFVGGEKELPIYAIQSVKYMNNRSNIRLLLKPM